MKKDYFSYFPDTFKGIDISECCKHHDNEVGMRGTYNPVTPHINFYKCLKGKGISFLWRCIITFGGAFFSTLEMPYLYYKKYKYRKNLKKGK